MSRIESEKQIVTAMIKVYCHKKHQHKNSLCVECEDLNNYALKRLSYCRHGESKGFCSNCQTHCYAPQYKEKIKQVMRFSGPWMLLYYPIIAIRHLVEDIKYKKTKNNSN